MLHISDEKIKSTLLEYPLPKAITSEYLDNIFNALHIDLDENGYLATLEYNKKIIKKLIELAEDGSRAYNAHYLANFCGYEVDWAKQIIENDISGDRPDAAYRLTICHPEQLEWAKKIIVDSKHGTKALSAHYLAVAFKNKKIDGLNEWAVEVIGSTQLGLPDYASALAVVDLGANVKWAQQVIDNYKNKHDVTLMAVDILVNYVTNADNVYLHNLKNSIIQWAQSILNDVPAPSRLDYVVDMVREFNVDIEWAKKIIEKETEGDPPLMAGILAQVHRHPSTIEWSMDFIERAEVGDPPAGAAIIASLHRPYIDRAKKVIETSTIGCPSIAAFNLATKYPELSEWAEKII